MTSLLLLFVLIITNTVIFFLMILVTGLRYHCHHHRPPPHHQHAHLTGTTVTAIINTVVPAAVKWSGRGVLGSLSGVVAWRLPGNTPRPFHIQVAIHKSRTSLVVGRGVEFSVSGAECSLNCLDQIHKVTIPLPVKWILLAS